MFESIYYYTHPKNLFFSISQKKKNPSLIEELKKIQGPLINFFASPSKPKPTMQCSKLKNNIVLEKQTLSKFQLVAQKYSNPTWIIFYHPITNRLHLSSITETNQPTNQLYVGFLRFLISTVCFLLKNKMSLTISISRQFYHLPPRRTTVACMAFKTQVGSDTNFDCSDNHSPQINSFQNSWTPRVCHPLVFIVTQFLAGGLWTRGKIHDKLQKKSLFGFFKCWMDENKCHVRLKRSSSAHQKPFIYKIDSLKLTLVVYYFPSQLEKVVQLIIDIYLQRNVKF